MRKQQTDRTVYKPNETVKITVTNKPVIDDDTGEIYMYETSVTLAVKKYNTERPLRFKDDDELTEYIGNIDLDDHNPQTSLLDAGEKTEA